MNKFWGLVALATAVSFQGCTGGRSKSKPDGNFRELISSDVANFNFLTENDAIQSDVLANVYESLLDRDPETYEILPLLAKSYEISKDGMSFTFELDEKAHWPDGKPVTSTDVAFSLEAMFDPKVNSGVLKAVYGSLDPKIKIISDSKFVIKAKTRHFKNLDLASGFYIMPKHLLEAKDLNKGPLVSETWGSGPYMLEEWKKGDSIILKKNSAYWGAHLKQNQGKNNFAKMISKVVREPKVGIELLKEGFFTAYSFNEERWERDAKHDKIQANYDTYTFVNKAPKGYSFIAWNNKVEPFTSRDVRMALSYMLNRPFMIEKFTYGHALPAVGPIASTSMYAPKDLKPIEFSPEKANELFKKAGWKDTNNDNILDKGGRKLEFTLMFVNPDTEKYLTVYKEDLGKVGVICNLKRVDWNTFTKLLDDRKFEASILAWTASVHPDLEQIWHSDSQKNAGSNFVGYSNSQVDKLIRDAQKEFDTAKRIVLNQDIGRLIAADAPYTFFLERPTNFVAARKGIKRPKDFMNYYWGVSYWLPPEGSTGIAR